MSKQISGCLPGVWSERYSSRPRRRSHSFVVLFFIGVQFEHFGAQKVQNSILGKGFSQDVQFELFGSRKVQIGRLEKRFGGSIHGGSWEFTPLVPQHISH